MPLEFSVTQTAFRLGLAEGVEPRQAPAGTLTTAENCVWRKSGRIGKRFGISQLSGSAGTSSRLMTRGSQLVINGTENGENELFTYSPAQASILAVGDMPVPALTWTTVNDSFAGIKNYDVATSSLGYTIHAWISGDPTTAAVNTAQSLYFRVDDTETGATIMPTTRLVSQYCHGVRVLVMDAGATAVVVTRTDSVEPFTYVAHAIDPGGLSVGATVNLRTDGETPGGTSYSGWDVCKTSDTVFVLAYCRTGPVVALESYSSAGVSAASGTVTEASGCSMISIAGSTTNGSLYVLYTQGAASPEPTKIGVVNAATLAETVVPANIEAPGANDEGVLLGVCEYDATTCIAMLYLDTDDGPKLTTYRVSNAGVVSATSARTTFSARPTSRPFLFGGRVYAMVTAHRDGYTNDWNGVSSGLIEIEVSDVSSYGFSPVPHVMVGKVEHLLGAVTTTSAPLADASLISATEAVLAYPYLSAASPSSMNLLCGAKLLTIQSGTSRPLGFGSWANVGDELYTVAPGLITYDGETAFDYGSMSAPVVDGAIAAGAGGMAAGDYIFAVVREYRSATGMLYRSAPSVPITETGGALGTATVYASVGGLTRKQTPPKGFGAQAPNPTTYALYRSTVGGAVPYRMSYEPTYNIYYDDATTLQTVMVNSVSDADITAGVGPVVSLSTRPVMYTEGGALDDDSPPSGVGLFHHANRLFVLAGDQKTWWFSKSFVDDLGVAPGFNAAFRISFPESQTCGASLDDKAVFFSASSIRYMLGQGPSVNGTNNDFSQPIQVQTDVGCSNPRSVVETPDGLMFLSERGIYLLSRGLELSWIGRPVQDVLVSYPSITSAVLVPGQNQVRFTANNSATTPTAGVTLVYDYVERQWSTFRHTVSAVYGATYADACMHNGQWTFVTTAGIVCQENTGYLDVSAYVPMTVETAWLSAAGPMAFHSVRTFGLHGTSHTNHDLTISVGFDSNDTYQQTATFAAQSAVTTIGDEDCTVTIGTRRKCNTIRFKIVDATPTTGAVSTGRGPSWDMLALDVGVKRGIGNTIATKRA